MSQIADPVRIVNSAANPIPVTLSAGPAIDIGDVQLLAGNANIGDVDVASIAAGDNNIGNVDVVTMPAAVLSASELHIGEVGGKGIQVAITIIRPANVTQYAAKDIIGGSLAVSAATNATPIVVTVPTHGLADGDPVTIGGCVGNTAANGNFYAKVTTYSGTTFALYSDKALTTPVSGNGVWSSGGIVVKLNRLPNFFRTNGGSGYITKLRVMTNLATFLDTLKIHFYDSVIGAIEDNLQFTLLFANAGARLGAVTVNLGTEGTGSDASAGVAVPGDGSGLPLFVRNNDNSKDLYFRIETLGTGTPASAQQFFFEATLDSN